MQKKYLYRKLVVAIISSLLLCSWIAYLVYTPTLEQDEGSLYWSFLIIYLIYATPVFLIGGVLFSILVDKLRSTINWFSTYKKMDFIICLIIYGIGGTVVVLIFLIFITEGRIFNDTGVYWWFYVYGIVGSVCYYFIDEIAKYILSSNMNKEVSK
jgi:hypothetical protein